jgi:chaperonin GroEL
MLNHGYAALTQGYRVVDVIRGMEEAIEIALSSLVSQAKHASTTDLFNVAQTASGDSSIASIVERAFAGAGKDGVITVSLTNDLQPSLQLHEGLRIDRGYISEPFVNTPDRQECTLEDCRIPICDRRISNMKVMLPVLERAPLTPLCFAAANGQELLGEIDLCPGHRLDFLVTHPGIERQI